MQEAVVLFGAQRWGKEYVVDMIRQTGATIVWPHEWQRAIGLANKTVIALDDFVAEEALAVAEALAVPFYPANAHTTTFKKHLLRQLWNELAATQPHLQAVPFVLLQPGAPVASTPPFPVIIKPDAYSGSVGVAMATTAEDLAIKLEWLKGVLQEERKRFADDFEVCQDVLMEAAIARKPIAGCEAEFTLHMLSLDGTHRLLATSQKQIDPDTFIEVGHTVPAISIPQAFIDGAADATANLLGQLGVQKCISNWEYIVTPDNQIALIEGQLRPSGDRLMQLIQLSTGINPFAALLHGNIQPDRSLSAQIRWLGPSEVRFADGQVTIPGLPNGWQTIVDVAALQDNPHWPGPIDWYNRHVAVMGTL